MRDPNIILDILKKRSLNKLEIDNIYPLMYKETFYILARNKLHKKKSNDNDNKIALIDKIISEMRYERYKWNCNEWSDKLVEEVIRIILSAIYEPKFLECSHAYRPNKGCNTALTRVVTKGRAAEWFIKGDIENSFESINYNILLNILRKTIKDNRFIELIRKLIKSKRLNKSIVYNTTYSNTPTGGILSPLLLNIYLNELDHYIEDEFNNLKRFSYTRYADSWVITYIGTQNEVKEIKEKIENYLVLKLSLLNINIRIVKSDNKKEPIKFLGYNIITQWSKSKISNHQRSISGDIALLIPHDVIIDIRRKYMKNNKPIHIGYRSLLTVHDIINSYQNEFKNICQYYKFARNQKELSSLKWVIETSLMKTLANKFKSTVTKMYKKYGATQIVNNTSYKVIKESNDSVYFGAIPLKVTKPCNNIYLNDHKL